MSAATPPPTTDRQPLRCDECGTTIAELRDDVIVIRARHHGQWHTTLLPVARLLALVERAAGSGVARR